MSLQNSRRDLTDEAENNLYSLFFLKGKKMDTIKVSPQLEPPRGRSDW